MGLGRWWTLYLPNTSMLFLWAGILWNPLYLISKIIKFIRMTNINLCWSIKCSQIVLFSKVLRLFVYCKSLFAWHIFWLILQLFCCALVVRFFLIIVPFLYEIKGFESWFLELEIFWQTPTEVSNTPRVWSCTFTPQTAAVKSCSPLTMGAINGSEQSAFCTTHLFSLCRCKYGM